MKKIFFSLVILTSMFLQVNATGLVTNTNQSASFTRLQNRNASTGIDAVYYNPAGVTKLGNGFFASLNNQTISQTKTVLVSDYLLFGNKPKEYVGDVSAPLYPGVYAAFNTGKLSISVGFNPIGGGGGAKYKTGLPSFEMPISAIPALLNANGITTSGYKADIYFEGSSIYFGYQLNVAYKINEQLSVGAGVRMVTAKNTYEGYIKNIKINPNQQAFNPKYNGTDFYLAKDFFTDGSTFLTGLSTTAPSAAAGLQTAAEAGHFGAGGLATPWNMLPVSVRGDVEALLGAAKISTDGLTLGDVIGKLRDEAPGRLIAAAAEMTGSAAQAQDRLVEGVEQKGTGFSPILSVNYAPSDMFNFSLRYEFKTNLKLKTTVPAGKGGGVFVDGDEVIADMPALLAIGAQVRPLPMLSIAATFNTFFDKNVDYSNGKNIDMIKRNYIEYGLGVEYGITEKLRASVGWLGTNTGILPEYQNDQRFSSNSNSFGIGAAYRINPMIDVNLGFQYSINADYKNACTFKPTAATSLPYFETYGKKTMIFAIGVDLFFGK